MALHVVGDVLQEEHPGGDLLQLASLCLLSRHFVSRALGGCEGHCLGVAGNTREVSKMNSDSAIGKDIPKAVLIAVVDPLDDIGGQAGRVDDFFNTTSMNIA